MSAGIPHMAGLFEQPPGESGPKVDRWEGLVSNVRLAFLAAAFALTSCQASGGAVPASPQAPASHPAPASRPPLLRSHCVSLSWSCTPLGTFADPYGVAVDPRCTAACDVYVADPGSRTVWRIAGGSQTAIGNGIKDPQSVAVSPNGDVYVADKANCTFWRIAAGGQTTPFYNFANYGCNILLQYARGVTVDARGAVYGNITIGAFGHLDCRGEPLDMALGPPGVIAGRDFLDVYSVAVNAAGNRLYVADAGKKAVYELNDPKGNYTIGDLGKVFADPYGVAVDWRTNFVYVADAGDKRVWEYANGSWTPIASFVDPYSVAVDGRGDLYVADPGSKLVYRLSRHGAAPHGGTQRTLHPIAAHMKPSYTYCYGSRRH